MSLHLSHFEAFFNVAKCFVYFTAGFMVNEY